MYCCLSCLSCEEEEEVEEDEEDDEEDEMSSTSWLTFKVAPRCPVYGNTPSIQTEALLVDSDDVITVP